MSIKFNDTQLVLLSAASQRDDHCLVPPAGPNRGQSQRAVAKLLEAGLLKEIRAKAGAPIWRRDEETGQTYALKLTAAGAKTIAVDDATRFESKKAGRVDHPIVSVDPMPEPGSLGEDLLDPGPAAAQEIEGGVEFVLVDLAQAEHGAERVSGGRLAELARGRQLGGRFDDPRH